MINGEPIFSHVCSLDIPISRESPCLSRSSGKEAHSSSRHQNDEDSRHSGSTCPAHYSVENLALISIDLHARASLLINITSMKSYPVGLVNALLSVGTMRNERAMMIAHPRTPLRRTVLIIHHGTTIGALRTSSAR